MTRRPLHNAMALTVALMLTISLAACLPDRPANADRWLHDQPGIVGTEILSSDNGEFQSRGNVQGELDPNISADQFTSLVESVAEYVANNDQVGIRLGRNGIDFGVTADSRSNDAAIALWRKVAGVQNVGGALVWDDSVHVQALRTNAVQVLADLDALDADVTLEGFADLGTAGVIWDDQLFNIDSLELDLPQGCSPPPAERSVAESFFARDEVQGGHLVLCASFDVYYRSGSSLATRVLPLYDELTAADLLQLPVTAHQIVGSAPDGHLVAVTPGDRGALDVLAVFDGAPAALNYELGADRSLKVWEYGSATGDLLALLSASPAAAGLPSIRIEGETSAISGPLADLPLMLEQVTPLAAASDVFTNVELGPTTGQLDLNSAVGADPDVVAAAAALRASGATEGRTFKVMNRGGFVEITDGVPKLGSDTYTDPHVLEAFVAAWNATAG